MYGFKRNVIFIVCLCLTMLFIVGCDQQNNYLRYNNAIVLHIIHYNNSGGIIKEYFTTEQFFSHGSNYVQFTDIESDLKVRIFNGTIVRTTIPQFTHKQLNFKKLIIKKEIQDIPNEATSKIDKIPEIIINNYNQQNK